MSVFEELWKNVLKKGLTWQILHSKRFSPTGADRWFGVANEKAKIVIGIKDSGIGIDPEIMPRLFTKFATKSFQGTGLGLFISKNIVEDHGGKNKKDGRGSIFYLSHH
jgi:signal transduction histidine kinase